LAPRHASTASPTVKKTLPPIFVTKLASLSLWITCHLGFVMASWETKPKQGPRLEIWTTNLHHEKYILGVRIRINHCMTSIPPEARLFCNSNREAIPDISMFIKSATQKKMKQITMWDIYIYICRKKERKKENTS